MENGLSASDVALMNRDTGFGGEAFMWIFALLILAGGGFNGWGGNNQSDGFLAQDMNRGFDNQNLQAQTRDILAAVNAGTAQGVAATNQTFHDNLAAMQSMYNETARDIAGLAVGQAQNLANQNECCCSTKLLIAETGSNLAAQTAQNKYENAMQMTQMEARLTAKMDANEIQNLRDQVGQLQLQNQMLGVVRYPNTWAYNAGSSPFCNCTTTSSGAGA